MIENMDYIHACAYVGVISILVLLPVIIWNDIKYRTIPPWTLWILIGLNMPAIYVLYSEGLPLFYIMLSIIMTALFAVLYKMGALKGGDFKILTIISWFCPLNPLNPNDTFFQIQFVIFLSAVAILWMIYVYFKNRKLDPSIIKEATLRLLFSNNRHHGKCIEPLVMSNLSLWEKFNNYPRGSPWVVPIAVAFIITAVFG